MRCALSESRSPRALAPTLAIFVMVVLGNMSARATTPCATQLDCPPDLYLTTSGSGTKPELNITATNPCVADLTVQCYLGAATGVPVQPDTVFPVGTNLVTCLAMDETGNELTNCSFRVIVALDTQPPRLVKPARMIVPCTEPGGAVVAFTAGALDDFDAEPSVVCDPPSGSLFHAGTNTVRCTARDAAGNRTIEQFEVIVSGDCGISRCLELAAPEDITIPCTNPDGAMVEFAAAARNRCTGADVPIVCVPPSDSVFPVGITRVVCSVDADGLQGSTSFLVEVIDTEPPLITCPGNMTVAARSPLGAVVEYAVAATDDCTAAPSVRCAPASGTVFPVGETRVYCEAADGSGNASQCVFLVTVLPPEPLAISHLDSDRVELRWTGEAVVETVPDLEPSSTWHELGETPTAEGDFWVLERPVSEQSQYFRLRHLPVVPPPDRDRDGLPDEEDRCPDTPMGLPVDETGCAVFDLIATPGQALAADEDTLRSLRDKLSRWPSTEALAAFIPVTDDGASGPRARLLVRDYAAALAETSRQAGELDRALAELMQTRAQRLEELERRGPFLSDDYADVRNADHELADLARFEETLTESLGRSRQLWLNLSNVVRAAELSGSREQVQIESLDNERGVAVLADGTQVLLPRPGTAAAPALELIEDAIVENSLVDMTVSPLPDGSSLALEAVSSGDVSALPVADLFPRRLELRVTPVDFGLPEFDLAPRHRLEAYRWGFTENSSRLYLEFNQALAAVPYLTFDGRDEYVNWLKIDVDLNNDGNYWALVMKMDATTPAYVMRRGTLPAFQPFSMRVREFRKLVDGSSATSELVYEEFHTVELNDPGFYAEASYDRTAFELENTSLNPGHQIAHVTSVERRFPLTLKPANEFTFSGTSFEVVGGFSTFPNVGPIGLNEPFAVHNQDPNDLLWFANTNDLPRGIYRPTLKGFNNGYLFRYRVELPFIVRDRLHACAGLQPDTFYKIPLPGGYSVSQGINGDFTHNGWQQFAWDFPKPAFTPVVAARGGVVVDLRKSSSQSCYIPFIVNPDGTTGGCLNCMGSASANFVYIRHQDGTYAWYGHFRNNQVHVSLNQRVFRGTILGLVGTTGCSSGNHLHFHVVNPEETATIPVRFESYILGGAFIPCYLPPSNSGGTSTQ